MHKQPANYAVRTLVQEPRGCSRVPITNYGDPRDPPLALPTKLTGKTSNPQSELTERFSLAQPLGASLCLSHGLFRFRSDVTNLSWHCRESSVISSMTNRTPRDTGRPPSRSPYALLLPPTSPLGRQCKASDTKPRAC